MQQWNASRTVAIRIHERRREARLQVMTQAALSPLGSVAANLRAEVLDVSSHGVKVRVSGSTLPPPGLGDLYRVRGNSDRMLCRVAYWRASDEGTEIGFRIVYWHESGELNRLLADQSQKGKSSLLRDLKIPGLA